MGGIAICGRCGSEVRVSDDCGGACPHCGSYVCAGTFDSIQYENDKRERHENEIEERMKHVIRVVVECEEAEDDRIERWSKEFTNIEEAREWAISQHCPNDIYYYDKKGLIE